jgi:PsbP-like protein
MPAVFDSEGRPLSTDQPENAGDEVTLWHNEITRGIFHKKVVETQEITTYRVVQNKTQILLRDLDDIIIMNQHRVSESQHTGYYSGMYYSRFGYGSGNSTSRTVGDVVFLYQGRPAIVFRQIADPYGIARLAKAERKRILGMIKATQKIQTQRQRVEKTVAKSSERKQDQALCARCGFINAKGSNYCSKCAFNLSVSVASSSLQKVPTPTADSPDNSTNVGEQKSFLFYESPPYGIKMGYPKDWLVTDKPSDKFVVGFAPLTDTRSAVVCVEIRSQPVGTTLQSESEQSLKNLRGNIPNIHLIEFAECTLAGLPAYRLVWDGGVSTKTDLCVFTIRANKKYSIFFNSEVEKYSIYLPTVEKMIKSFEFTNPSIDSSSTVSI